MCREARWLGQRGAKAEQSHGHSGRRHWIGWYSPSRLTRLWQRQVNVGVHWVRAKRVLHGWCARCRIVLDAARNLLTCTCRVWRQASTGGEKTGRLLSYDAHFYLFRLHHWCLSSGWLGHGCNHGRILGELETQRLVSIATLCGSLTALRGLHRSLLRFSARVGGFFSGVQEFAIVALVASIALEETAQLLARLTGARLRVLECAELVRAFRIVAANLARHFD